MQKRLEEVYLHILTRLQARTGMSDLCLAGGVALNCVANGVDLEPHCQGSTAPAGCRRLRHRARRRLLRLEPGLGLPSSVMRHAYTGPEYSDAEFAAALQSAGLDSTHR